MNFIVASIVICKCKACKGKTNTLYSSMIRELNRCRLCGDKKQIKIKSIMKAFLKVGSVELSEKEVYEIYSSNKLIVQYKGVYQILYSHGTNEYHSRKVVEIKGLVSSGRFHVLTADYVREIVESNNKKLVL